MTDLNFTGPDDLDLALEANRAELAGLTATPSTMAQMLDRVATDDALTQGAKVTLSAALRILDGHPLLRLALGAGLAEQTVAEVVEEIKRQARHDVDELTQALDARIKAASKLAMPIIRPSAQPHPTGGCVAPCEDCRTLTACQMKPEND